ncbi:hypothetical protein DUNSADRAFT_4819 [Dunaliella salina]|uniref:Cullin N-terminal domain-containing protein n=1 Tax=Dunaliella salina TaxID=3046 RepID=A0ABQ7FVG8_DUNSA|nr:hypothetical protein DUNSADRAFT_4819 [Dunaliella salina]|eukprot:KAF5826107.1 hypothetical protein DUNSADRAFT_4819 [Dunaliella salina]
MNGIQAPKKCGSVDIKASAADGANRAGPKQLKIKPLKSKPGLPANFEEVTWAKLQDAVRAVYHKRPVSCSLEELYSAVQDMCMHKMADKLYTNLQQHMRVHVCENKVGAGEKSCVLEISSATLLMLHHVFICCVYRPHSSIEPFNFL